MKAETILEKYFPLVIVDEDEWAMHVVKAMHEFAEHQNKELINWAKDELLKHKKTAEIYIWNSDDLYSKHMNKAEIFKQILERLK